jgi:hypothetical protein
MINKSISLAKSIIFLSDSLKEYDISTKNYNNIINEHGKNKLNKNQKEEILSYYSNLHIPIRNTLAHEAFYCLTGDFNPKYIPRHLFRNVLIPNYNQSNTWINRLRIWKDKNLFDILKIEQFVPTEGRIIRGRLLDKNYKPTNELGLLKHFESSTNEVVAKITNSSAGRGIFFIPIGDFSAWLEGAIVKSEKLNINFSLQLPFNQHKLMANLNPTSVNTLRITTVRLNNSIHSFSPFVRFGIKGSRVDNVGAGNLCVGLDSNGRLKPDIFDKSGHKFEHKSSEHNGNYDIKVPSFEECLKLCLNAHEYLYDLDIIAWDVVIDKNGKPYILEFNIQYLDADLNQFCNGPFFGDMTDQILSNTTLTWYQKLSI